VIHPISPDDLDDVLRYEQSRPPVDRSLYWSDRWDPEFYVALARAGFISIATRHPELGELLLAELQAIYAVLDWSNLHLSRKLGKLLRSKRLEEEQIELRVADSCDRVIERLVAYHARESWLVPRLQALLRELDRRPQDGFALHAVELWSRRHDELVAGELGYTLGRTYTSLSGFCSPADSRWRHFGTLQMVQLAERLRDGGFAFWNLGHPHMEYKRAIGARWVQRERFLGRWRQAIDEPPSVPLSSRRKAEGAEERQMPQGRGARSP